MMINDEAYKMFGKLSLGKSSFFFFLRALVGVIFGLTLVTLCHAFCSPYHFVSFIRYYENIFSTSFKSFWFMKKIQMSYNDTLIKIKSGKIRGKIFQVAAVNNIKRMIKSFFVSVTLTVVEALKYPPFHGICFSDEIFSILNLVSDIFSY